MATADNTPCTSDAEEEAKEEERFEFKVAELEDDHVWLR